MNEHNYSMIERNNQFQRDRNPNNINNINYLNTNNQLNHAYHNIKTPMGQKNTQNYKLPERYKYNRNAKRNHSDYDSQVNEL